jgi:predicted transcriptional regulator
MNAILSIKPQFVTEIVAGKKLYEYRKAIFKQPVEKVYIYVSAPVSKVVGEFQPVEVIQGTPEEVWQQTQDYAGIRKEWYDLYYQGKTTAYAIAIQNLKIYKTPKELPFHAPQSFRYIETL